MYVDIARPPTTYIHSIHSHTTTAGWWTLGWAAPSSKLSSQGVGGPWAAISSAMGPRATVGGLEVAHPAHYLPSAL